MAAAFALARLAAAVALTLTRARRTWGSTFPGRIRRGAHGGARSGYDDGGASPSTPDKQAGSGGAWIQRRRGWIWRRRPRSRPDRVWFLDKAAVDNGDRRAWSLCTVVQVEEVKTILHMIPVFLSSILAYIPFSLLLPISVEQAATMDTRLGGITIPAATLTVIPVFVQILILLVYDRTIVPWLRRVTGYAGGVTHLQRAGVGFASSVLAITTAALAEGRRLRRSSPSTMSAFWLTPQFVLPCILDVTSFVGLLEFFYSEVSTGMKSLGTSVIFRILGIASWLGSLLIQVVNDVTPGHGWLGGANLNASRLDLFYCLLAVLELVSFGLYVLCARSYTYRHDPRIQATTTDGSEAADQHTC